MDPSLQRGLGANRQRKKQNVSTFASSNFLAASVFLGYVLRSAKTGRRYTGSCKDLVERLRRDNTGESKSTRPAMSWQLIYSESFESRAEAMSRERYLKTLAGRAEREIAYAYDADNRLIEVAPAEPMEGNLLVQCADDYMGRRVRKVADEWLEPLRPPAEQSVPGWSVEPVEDIRFVYDGWNLVMERESIGEEDEIGRAKYAWGLDLAGLNGAVAPVPNRWTSNNEPIHGAVVIDRRST